MVAQISEVIPEICKDSSVKAGLDKVIDRFTDVQSFQKLLPNLAMADDDEKGNPSVEAAPEETLSRRLSVG